MNLSNVNGEEEIEKDSRDTFQAHHLGVSLAVGHKDERENVPSMWAESVAIRR